MSVHQKFVDEVVKNTVWFRPEHQISARNINNLVQKHQESLKLFGLKNIFPCQTIPIWPGKFPIEVMHLQAESRKSLLFMLLGNALRMVREVAVVNGRVAELDEAKREVSRRITTAAKRSAIESAGLSAKATMAIPMMQAGEPQPKDVVEGVTDVDVMNKAVEEAAEACSWYISWEVVGDLLAAKNYQNPFTPLVELFKMGLWPLGATQKEYLVLIPGGRRTEILP